MTRILSAFNLLTRVGFAVLLLGAMTATAQPYEPIRLYDMIGDTMQHFGEAVLESLGDQDGDGYDDILVNVEGSNQHLRIIYGGNTSPYRTLDFAYWNIDTTTLGYNWTCRFRNAGESICADYTGDGVVDILVDLYASTSPTTSPYFLFIGGGGPEEFDTVWDWRTLWTSPSVSLTGLGNFAGTGTPNFVRSDGAFAGTTLWYFDWSWPNPPMEPTWSVERDGPNNNGNFQSSQGVGDVTRDGWPDFMEIAQYPDWSRHYEIWYGGPNADSIPDFQFRQDTLSVDIDVYGIIGDVNGDGTDDIGAYVFDPFAPQRGPAIFYGGLPLNVLEPDVMLEHNSGEAVWLDRAQTVGDINDDGYEDIGVADIDRNSCYLYLGGNPMDSLWSFYIPEAEFDGFRTSLVRGIGDFNGDGVDDWAISAYEDWFTTPRRGRVVVFAGDRSWGVPVSKERPALPNDFVLGTPYPNPFNFEVIIPLTISRNAGSLDVAIYNTLGQLVYSFPEQHLTPGNTHFLRWNGRNSLGYELASGDYFVRANAGESSALKKVVLLK